ncbi:MAG: PTS sugar transporter subunit IIA, partial [Candidatus Hydrogenedentota bacterium]
PHVRSGAVKEPAVGLGLSPAGVDYDTLDNQPVHIIVLFAMPSGSQKDYLGLLAQVMLAIKTEGFKERLLSCTTPKEATDVVNNTEI